MGTQVDTGREPASTASAAGLEDGAVAVQATPVSLSLPEHVTILLAEDDPDVSDLVRHVLEAEGYCVEVARDGKEALERYETCRPALVLLDVMMPRLTGFEVLARLRALDDAAKCVPVLVLSARGAEEDIVKGFQLGVTDYVTKPFMIGELRARVRSLLARA